MYAACKKHTCSKQGAGPKQTAETNCTIEIQLKLQVTHTHARADEPNAQIYSCMAKDKKHGEPTYRYAYSPIARQLAMNTSIVHALQMGLQAADKQNNNK